MQKELKNLESNVLKEWQDLMKEAKKMTYDFLGQVDGMEKELEERAKEFQRRVEEIKEIYKKQLNDMKLSNLAILKEQEKMVSEGLEKVKQEIKECEDRLRSSDMESLLEHKGAKDKKKDPLPKLSCVAPPVLTPSQIDTKALTEMFGQLTVQKATNEDEGHTSQPSTDTSHDTEKPSMTKKPTASKTKQPEATGHVMSPRASPIGTQTHGAAAAITPPTQLIPKPSVQSKFHTETHGPSVICLGSGEAWVQTGRRTIQLVDRHVTVKDTIHIDFGFSDMVLSPQGDILLTDRTNKCIKSVSADKTVKTLFKVKWEPWGLCCLNSGHIAVTLYMDGRVIIYSASGKVIKELGKKLFRGPIRVAQSKVNSDLYISDLGADKVMALYKDYRVRYEYSGQRDRENPFFPDGLCTDNAGHILITDRTNHKVHILDKDGQFMKYLLTEEQGLRGPWSVDVDSAGNAWVGQYDGGVKVVKYLQ